MQNTCEGVVITEAPNIAVYQGPRARIRQFKNRGPDSSRAKIDLY